MMIYFFLNSNKPTNKYLLVFLLFLLSNGAFSQTKIKNDSIKPYIEFLQKNKFPTAKDYILEKFKTHNIVILSERHHADMTQYEVIIDVIKDEDFKGNVYTEVGVSNMYQKINHFLLNDKLSEEEQEQELLNIYRDIDYTVVWEKYNYYYLLNEIYNINKTRNLKDKILLFPTDIAFDWNDFTTSEKYAFFDNLIENPYFGIDRNVIMGKNFVSFYEFSKQRNPQRKQALVIQNTYHAYVRIPTYLPLPSKPDIYSTGEYIYKTYPEQTFCIYINFLKSGSFDSLSNNGIIDASFAYTKTDNIGFDLKGTPVGNTVFDLYNFGENYDTVNYDYIFDGLIFYKPVTEMVLKWNIPNIYPKEWEEQYFKRIVVSSDLTVEEVKKDKNYSDLKAVNISYENKLNEDALQKIGHQISKWIE
ncbi:MAG: hypothetical protein RBR78_10390 [Flavobacteriaceae bacterium]|jgi:hypothetical protein|nr:hypothetical protein [Flavobacteriaceae bacterium]